MAAYRDPEAQWTLRSLFQRAAHPERVRVGVVWQVVPGEDDHLVRVAGEADAAWLRMRGWVREVRIPAGERGGRRAHPVQAL